MKLILTHEVTGLGAAGDVVEVKDGYARNYLLPRGFATPWTKGGQKQVDAITKARETRAIKDLDEAKSVKGRLEGVPVTVAAKTGKGGRLFGAVSATEIVAAIVGAGGPQVDRRKVEVQGHIKAVGTYQATVRLHPDVSARVTVKVVEA